MSTLTTRHGARGALLLRAWWWYVGAAIMAGSVLLHSPTASAELLKPNGSDFWDFWAAIGLTRTPPDCAPEVPKGSPTQGTGAGWVSGFVWSDDNNDGQKQSKELGLPNVIVLLYALDLGEGTNTKNLGDPIAWTWTEWDGSYLFTNLDGGTYKVVEQQPFAFHDGWDVPGQIGGGAGGAPLGSDGFTDEKNSFVILLPDEGYAVNFNFGEWGLSGAYASKRLLMNGSPPLIPEPSTLGLACAAGAALLATALRQLRSRRHSHIR